MVDLEPCPFCGKRLELNKSFTTRTQDHFTHPELGDDQEPCIIETINIVEHHDKSRIMGVSSVEAWNKRAAMLAVTMPSIAAIAAERVRQIAIGYDAAHDDAHKGREIITASWGALEKLRGAIIAGRHGDREVYTRELTQAAAQIAAEIERVQRAALAKLEDQP